MESLAPPGTEDHITSSASSTYVSKKNSETDRLLSLRYTLPDGSTSNVFDLTWNNNVEVWYCRACRCPVMGQVFNHEAGKRHVAALEAASMPRNRQRSPPASAMKMVSSGPSIDWDELASNANSAEVKEEVKVAPGEPVPPGFEGEVAKVAQIQERLDNFKTSSLIGLEYLLELQDYDEDREPTYFCLLCGKKGDSRTIIPHLVSYNHLQYYLQRHYSKVFNELLPFASHKKFKKCWHDALTKVADAIENKYGRMLPHQMDMATYERSKQEVFNKINNGPHFSESNGITFEELVNRDEIIRISEKAFRDDLNQDKKPYDAPNSRNERNDSEDSRQKRRRSVCSVSSISSDDFDASNDRARNRARDRDRSRDRIRDRTTKTPSTLYNRRRSRSRSRSPYKRRTTETSLPWNRPEYRKNEYTSAKDQRKERDRDRGDEKESKKDEFRRLAAAIEKDMEKDMRKHQMNPEKHPQYNDEWKIFWNKRYKELQTEGRDTQGYDFKPEWIIYWNKKMEEFHKAAVKQKIDALRRRLGLAEVPAPISFRINSSSTSTSSSSLRRRDMKTGCQPVAAQPDQDHEVIVIDDAHDDRKPRSKPRERSHSPWESDTNSPRKDHRRPTAGQRKTTRTRSRSKSRSLSPYRRRSYGRRRSRSRSRSKSYRGYRRSTRSKSKSPTIRRDLDSGIKPMACLDSPEWNRAVSYKKLLPSGKDTIMVRESTLKKQALLDEQLSAVEDLGADVNVVAVLRLLTALEDKLGSLGPKVVDLLAMALSMEKKEPNSGEKLLDDEANCVLFETIKEKLKGLLHAGLVTGYSSQEKAIKTSITKIAGLLHLANKRKTEKEAKKAAVMKIDKVAIAKQIANALVLQGKTDVTTAELEQLVNTVVKMAEASKESDKPMTTASFLEMLKQNQSKAKTDAVKPQIDAEKPPTAPKMQEKETSALPKDAMDGLSDLELQTLLQSFKDLSAEEQHGLISYLKKLEAKEPARVETLRKFVNMDPSTSTTENAASTSVKLEELPSSQGRISPFSKKLSESSNISKVVALGGAVTDAKIGISDDEEDYSYEDVFKAANKNLKEQKQPDATNMSNVIANIMGSINTAKSNNKTSTMEVKKEAQTPQNNFQPQTSQVSVKNLQTLQNQQPPPKNLINNQPMNGNRGNMGNFPPRPQQQQQQQMQHQQMLQNPQPYRQFQQNRPSGPQNMRQMQGNHPQNMHFQENNMQQQRFYPNNGNMDGNPNNQNYNYYNRW